MYTFLKLFFLLTLTSEIFACTEELTNKIINLRSLPSDEEYLDYFYDNVMVSEPVIESSTITCSNISSISDIDSKFFNSSRNYAQFLNIRASTLLTVPPKAFAHVSSISKLYLIENHIKTIEPGAFENLTELEELHLDNNELSKLPSGVFNPLHQLKILSLNNNKIKRLDRLVFKGLDNLMHLALRNNVLSMFEDHLFETVQRLEYLDLSGNPLQRIPGRVPYLKNVLLSNASLTRFDMDLSNSTLKSVNLSSNLLTNVNFAKFAPVHLLDFSRNKITTLTNLLESNATYICLNNNGIAVVNQSFPDSVRELHLRHNSLKTLHKSMQNQSTALLRLDLGLNSVSEIEKTFFSGLGALEYLLLDHNNLTKIDTNLFHDLKNLLTLDLSHNKIKEFQFGSFDNLKSLTTLDVSHNKLVHLHEYAFSSLKNMEYLYFDNNQISSLDAVVLMDHTYNIQLISLDKNHWSCKDLVNMCHTFSRRGINIKQGESYSVENYHGIACINRREFEEHPNASGHLQRAIAKGMESFFNKDLKDSMLKYRSADSSSSNSAVTAIITIQLIVSCMVLFVISLIFVYLQKYLTHRRSEKLSSSQMELCANL